MSAVTPFHQGEKTIHQRLGLMEIDEWASQMVRPRMPDQHRQFFQNLPFVILAAKDGEGKAWATLVSAEEGFIVSPTADRLGVAAKPVPGDALEGALTPRTDIGLLGIELATRRRNRMNGRIGNSLADGFEVAVGQSFGNCPQYIRERNLWRVAEKPEPQAIRSETLNGPQRDWIARADTMFIASGFRGEGEDWAFGMDASHRGGERGFVEVIDGQTLRFADYAGNNHFNTLGNLMSDDRAGYLFIDFATGSLLQVSGRAEIDWDPSDEDRQSGAQRLITLRIEIVNEIRNATNLRWAEDADSVRSLQVIERVQETADVASFILAARDGGKLPAFEAGQHLPIDLPIPWLKGTVSRSYSLSGSPNAETYRISVKRKHGGLVSGFLHEAAYPGAVLSAHVPSGRFQPETADRPLVLIAGGIGITPLLSHLHAEAEKGGDREILLIQVVRDGGQHAFREEISLIAAARPSLRSVVIYSQPNDEDAGRFDFEGRLDQVKLAQLEIAADAEVLICGPAGFAADVQRHLLNLGQAEDQIQMESF